MRLQELMKEKGYTLQKVAEAAHATPAAVSYWMRGMRQPTADNIILIARFFGVTTDYILGVSDS